MFPVSLREGRGGFASVIPGLTENGVNRANSGFSSSWRVDQTWKIVKFYEHS